MESSGSSSVVQASFEELEKQKALITSCTLLWKELSDHFTSLEKELQIKSETLRSRLQTLDRSTQLNLDSLHRREHSIDASVDLALSKLDDRRHAALHLLAVPQPEDPPPDLTARLRSFCGKIDAGRFWDLLVSKRKEVEALRSELPLILSDCVDPPKFAMDTISRVFPVDQTAGKDANDLGWACVMILESLVPVLADPDPELGSARPLITPSIRQRAKEIADTWKEGLEKRGGVECAKPPDVHTFLQHVVTFGVVANEDKELYRKLIMSSSWRKQMPKLALSLGLGDRMIDMIEELISKGQQLDAVNFTFEAGVEDKFPPVPLLKSYLEESKKAATSILEDRNNSGRAAHLASRKEQSALRAVIKCIEDHKLESDFSPDTLQKRLEQLEKTKIEKKKQVSGPAIKRTRANNGGPMPPAKAGRLTNHAHVSSFPAIPTFVRSPSAHSSYQAATASIPPPYAYDRPTGPAVYGSRSPPAIRDPYSSYPQEEVLVTPAALGMSYPGAPVMNYPLYGAYTNCLPPGGYQQTFYR